MYFVLENAVFIFLENKSLLSGEFSKRKLIPSRLLRLGSILITDITARAPQSNLLHNYEIKNARF
jgi:hypothetical protein